MFFSYLYDLLLFASKKEAEEESRQYPYQNSVKYQSSWQSIVMMIANSWQYYLVLYIM